MRSPGPSDANAVAGSPRENNFIYRVFRESAGCSTLSFPISGEERMLRCGGQGMKRSSTLDRLVEPVVRTFTPEVARALVGLRPIGNCKPAWMRWPRSATRGG